MLLPDEVKENERVFKLFVKFTLWTFIFIILIFVFIWQSIITAEFEYKIQQAEKRLTVFQKENTQLETEISFLSSPERIGKIAETELGLVPVDHEKIIWIDCNRKKDKNLFSKKIR